jgi:S-adenosylmethionine/arginine decarboxylase-like enzyme
MLHLTLDGFGGHRSRYDDIRLVQELLEEVPARLGLRPVMPPLLLPYYNGVEPDDCGISGFVFLAGGHFTLHTFSFREVYFADLVAPGVFEPEQAALIVKRALPAETTHLQAAGRGPQPSPRDGGVHPEEDFGPHLMMTIEGYQGPQDMDALFTRFDNLPERIDMTPIMRPYVLPSRLDDGSRVLSAMTMIAESHIALHWFEASQRAYFDIFSCKFFDVEGVLGELKAAFPGAHHDTRLLARGRGYTRYRTERSAEYERTRSWLPARPPLRQP